LHPEIETQMIKKRQESMSSRSIKPLAGLIQNQKPWRLDHRARQQNQTLFTLGQ
jgi:hypothetical protein